MKRVGDTPTDPEPLEVPTAKWSGLRYGQGFLRLARFLGVVIRARLLDLCLGGTLIEDCDRHLDPIRHVRWTSQRQRRLGWALGGLRVARNCTAQSFCVSVACA